MSMPGVFYTILCIAIPRKVCCLYKFNAKLAHALLDPQQVPRGTGRPVYTSSNTACMLR